MKNTAGLVRTVGCLYWMSKVKASWETAEKTMRRYIETIKPTKNFLSSDGDIEITNSLLDTAKWMLDTYGSIAFDQDDVTSRVNLISEGDSYLVEEVKQAIQRDMDEEGITRHVNVFLSELRHSMRQKDIYDTVTNFSRTVMNKGNVSGTLEAEWVKLKDQMEFLTARNEGGDGVGFISRFRSDDPDSLKNIIDMGKDLTMVKGALRTPYRGLNDMLGIGGVQRGHMLNVGALSHHYKTGLLLDFFRGAALYNKPYMIDADKKPLLIHISFENMIEQNLPHLFRTLYGQEFKTEVPFNSVSTDKATDYIIKRLESNGYTVVMESFNPTQVTVEDIIAMFERYKQEGYEIHMACFDYLELLANHVTERKDEAILNIIQGVRFYTFANNIAVVNGHQLSTQAQEIYRDRPLNFIPEIRDGGFYRNTKQLQTKVDVEILIARLKTPIGTFIHFGRGKHRGGELTPESKQVFAYRFNAEYGGILDDVEEEKSSAIYNLTSLLANVGNEEDQFEYDEAI